MRRHSNRTEGGLEEKVKKRTPTTTACFQIRSNVARVLIQAVVGLGMMALISISDGIGGDPGKMWSDVGLTQSHPAVQFG